MENKKLDELIERLESIQFGEIEFDEEEIKAEIYEMARNISEVDHLLSLACAVIKLPMSDDDGSSEIARNIVDLSIEIAANNEDVESLEKIVDELENSLEMDELADEVRGIIEGM